MPNKKAFSLPDLLITVVVLGLAAAVALPRVYKVLEQRNAQSAEAVLAQYRSEQEGRCVQEKQYSVDFASLPGILSQREDKHFTYELLPTGIAARRKGGYGYVLQMPSYEDGRLCCEDRDACQRLGKEYPSCSDLTARADYHSGEECSAFKKEPLCTGENTRPCGCQDKGRQTRTCDPQTDTWSEWSACSIPLTCDCSAVSGPRPAPQQQPCPQGGVQSRGFSCDTLTGQWMADPWGDCQLPAETPAEQPAETSNVSEEEQISSAEVASPPHEALSSGEPAAPGAEAVLADMSAPAAGVSPAAPEPAASGAETDVQKEAAAPGIAAGPAADAIPQNPPAAGTETNLPAVPVPPPAVQVPAEEQDFSAE